MNILFGIKSRLFRAAHRDGALIEIKMFNQGDREAVRALYTGDLGSVLHALSEVLAKALIVTACHGTGQVAEGARERLEAYFDGYKRRVFEALDEIDGRNGGGD